jgi:hypothetical protein
MGTMIKSIIKWAWSLLDITWSEWTHTLQKMMNDRGIKKHTRWIKRHFDSAYNKIK